MIHPTAIVSDEAKLGENVHIGPYAIIEKNVHIGNHCKLDAHTHVFGGTTIGENTRIHTGAVIGDIPQDTHFEDAPSYVEIGSNCIVREYVTIHRGSQAESTTRIGNHVMLMGLCHVAHNCIVEDHAVIANNALLAGHAEVGTRAFVSGAVLVQQFARIGCLAMAGGGARINQDLPPYCLFAEGAVHGPNVIALKRANMTPAERKAIREAIKTLYFKGLNRQNALAEISNTYSNHDAVSHLVAFVQSAKRGILPGKKVSKADCQ
jgi:UDP-N-acetylglucosamine acyltransferase